MSDDPYQSEVVARFVESAYRGSVIRRYNDGQYWHVYPDSRMVPGERLSMKRAAQRVAFHHGSVVRGVAPANKFYAAVERYQAENTEGIDRDRNTADADLAGPDVGGTSDQKPGSQRD